MTPKATTFRKVSLQPRWWLPHSSTNFKAFSLPHHVLSHLPRPWSHTQFRQSYIALGRKCRKVVTWLSGEGLPSLLNFYYKRMSVPLIWRVSCDESQLLWWRGWWLVCLEDNDLQYTGTIKFPKEFWRPSHLATSCLLLINLPPTHILVFVLWFSFLWNKWPRVGFLGHLASVCSIPLETAQLLSTAAVHLKVSSKQGSTGGVHLKETLAREVGSQGRNYRSLAVQDILENVHAHLTFEEPAQDCLWEATGATGVSGAANTQGTEQGCWWQLAPMLSHLQSLQGSIQGPDMLLATLWGGLCFQMLRIMGPAWCVFSSFCLSSNELFTAFSNPPADPEEEKDQFTAFPGSSPVDGDDS